MFARLSTDDDAAAQPPALRRPFAILLEIDAKGLIYVLKLHTEWTRNRSVAWRISNDNLEMSGESHGHLRQETVRAVRDRLEVVVVPIADFPKAIDAVPAACHLYSGDLPGTRFRDARLTDVGVDADAITFSIAWRVPTSRKHVIATLRVQDITKLIIASGDTAARREAIELMAGHMPLPIIKQLREGTDFADADEKVVPDYYAIDLAPLLASDRRPIRREARLLLARASDVRDRITNSDRDPGTLKP